MDNTIDLSTTSILSLFETNKDQRQSFALSVVDAIEQGRVDPLKAHLQVKCMEDIIKLINSNTIYKKAVLEQAEQYGQKSFQFNNAKIEIKEVGVKYDFSQTGDIIYHELLKKQSELEKQIKDREAMLKTVSEKGLVITEQETGETFTVYPPAKSSSTSVVVTLK